MKTSISVQQNTYKKLIRGRVAAFILFILILIIFAVWDIMIGSSSLTVPEALKIIFRINKEQDRYYYIIWGVRMPMTLTCICVGASLALAGEQTQTILQNPLASPYTLGISSAAGFGAAFGVVTGFPFIPIGWLNNSVSSLAFALFACGLISAMIRYRNAGTKDMVLFGIIINFLFTALQTLMQYMASREQLSEIMHWTFGSLSKASWEGVQVCSVNFAIFFMLSMLLSWKLTALSAGEERAQSLGIDTEKLRRRTFLYSSVLTAVTVSYVGSIGFIGLVAPHLARSYVGEDQRFLAPLSAIFGIIILLAASVMSKMLKPGEVIPVGIITNIVGVAFLSYLIIRKKI